jgi:hypothetical protein
VKRHADAMTLATRAHCNRSSQRAAPEVVRQGVGWGGPAAVITGAIGAVAGGLIGFFAGDRLAGMIDPK